MIMVKTLATGNKILRYRLQLINIAFFQKSLQQGCTDKNAFMNACKSFIEASYNMICCICYSKFIPE